MLWIVIIVLVLALALARACALSTKKKGKRGEKHIQKLLSKLPENEYTTFDDVVLKTAHGTTQIDHIVVSKYGVFVIETKNYRGDIFGNDDRQEWKQIIKTDVTFRSNLWKTYTYIKKSELYNPIFQSLGHEAQVRRILKHLPYANIVSIVVFSDQANLSGVHSSHHVINACQLLDCIRSYTIPHISEQDLTRVRMQLYDNNVREAITDKKHVKSVRKAQAYNESMIQKGICPRCGKELVYRKGKFGNFYGCSAYPTCRFTRQC